VAALHVSPVVGPAERRRADPHPGAALRVRKRQLGLPAHPRRVDRAGLPGRAGPAWTQFLTAQAKAILACDFLHVDTVGLKRVYAPLGGSVWTISSSTVNGISSPRWTNMSSITTDMGRTKPDDSCRPTPIWRHHQSRILPVHGYGDERSSMDSSASIPGLRSPNPVYGR